MNRPVSEPPQGEAASSPAGRTVHPELLVAAAILAAVEPWHPARRTGVKRSGGHRGARPHCR